ncbi:DUF4338 domain-containing protein [Candidatus Hakubella thermalkaliphila]|uniref:DUF4338 domain-containing protein n=1 Tax=Candidatus Hakubella thermalkaliphila TaxID=2754717 RepID=UPI002159621D|nr:DUF4338 domain-containing protein [Candidatus Hakubella thermalkaliphila]
MGLNNSEAGESNSRLSKNQIRTIHAAHRRETAQREAKMVGDHGQRLLNHFAEGSEVGVEAIDPELVLVDPDTEEANLFRIAALLWSVPVSRGFGRRMRFLVRDRSNQKLIGLLALGSPVFNLSPRDNWIGWTVRDREERLVNVMDAFVIGAVPPYSQLIGGKLVAALIGSGEVSQHFERRYGLKRGIISGKLKRAKLVLVTTTSALGHSSLYNRLRLPGLIEFHRLGTTNGWGHFQVPDSIFNQMRRLLELGGHKYASGYRYGDGPNWRLRVAREALERIGLDGNVMRHGIRREVYGVPLTENWREYLLGEDDDAILERPTVKEIADACIERWLLPRSKRRPQFRAWKRGDTWRLITQAIEP